MQVFYPANTSHLTPHTSDQYMFPLLQCTYPIKGKFEESLSMFSECVEGRRAVLGNEDKVTLASLVNLASSYENLHRFSEAIPLYSEAVKGDQAHILSHTL